MITLAELIKNSDIIPPANLVVDKNNCLGDWRDELQNASDKIKFDKCQEQREIGYFCDAHPTCNGCDYKLSDEVYESLGGKLVKRVQSKQS